MTVRKKNEEKKPTESPWGFGVGFKLWAVGVECTIPVALALLEFANRDVTRVWGCGIDDGGALAATDGHSLVRFTTCDPGGQDVRARFRTAWTAEYLETTIKLARSAKCNVSLTWDACAKGARSGELVKFPPTAQVVPPPGFSGKEIERTGINAMYLARLALVQRACYPRDAVSPGVVFSGMAGPFDPIRFDVAGPSATAEVVIMPMRI